MPARAGIFICAMPGAAHSGFSPISCRPFVDFRRFLASPAPDLLLVCRRICHRSAAGRRFAILSFGPAPD
ncbi:hypothetical protein [Burkholderia gladioli]|uniref:hypothetical protein n=1 Tax=Burkholderia gladioli TaxID=28095 RepID=UPI00163EA6D4|nr:hypothetical protein [Burkholderia gladioli]